MAPYGLILFGSEATWVIKVLVWLKLVWDAMKSVFEDGYSTADLSKTSNNIKLVSTDEFGDKVIERLSAYDGHEESFKLT